MSKHCKVKKRKLGGYAIEVTVRWLGVPVHRYMWTEEPFKRTTFRKKEDAKRKAKEIEENKSEK